MPTIFNMKMNKFFKSIPSYFFVLVLSFLLLGCGNDGLTFYQALYDNDGKKCDTDRLVKRSYKVDVANQIVLESIYYKDTLMKSEALTACKVIGDKDFSCGGERDYFGKTETISVVDGVLIVSSGYYSATGKKSSPESERCWFKKSFFGGGYTPINSRAP